MSFLDPKERVLDIILTQHGRRKLAKGEFLPKYFALSDDEVYYVPTSYSQATASIYEPSQEPGALMDQWAEYGIVTSGSDVASWTSYNSLGIEFGQGPAARPTYQATGFNNKPAVLYSSASSQYMTASSLTSTNGNYSLICVIDQKTLTAPEQWIWGSGNDLIAAPSATGTSPKKVGHYDGTSGYQNGTGNATTGPQILSWIFNASTGVAQYWRGNTIIGSGSYSTQLLLNTPALGASFSGQGACDLSIARIMLFEGVNERRDSRVRSWMADYYSLSL